MIVNRNLNTGIPYGIIAANSLCPDVVQELLYGPQATDLTYKAAWDDEVARQRREHDDLWRDHPAPEAFEPNDNHFDPTIDEPVVTGVYEGVHYESAWLGGALLFWVFESPFTRYYRPCSPCVPGAGDLDTPDEGGILCYDVPPDWRHCETE